MCRKMRYFLLTALLLISLALRAAVLSGSEEEKKAGAVFVKEVQYAENRV